MMMMMMSRFVQHVINSPQMRYRSGGPWDVEQMLRGRGLRFAGRLVNCSKWLDLRLQNSSSPAWSLSLVWTVNQCSVTESLLSCCLVPRHITGILYMSNNGRYFPYLSSSFCQCGWCDLKWGLSSCCNYYYQHLGLWLVTGMPQHIWNISRYIKCDCFEVVLQRIWLSTCHYVGDLTSCIYCLNFWQVFSCMFP